MAASEKISSGEERSKAPLIVLCPFEPFHKSRVYLIMDLWYDMESKKYIIFIDNTGKCALPLIAQHYDVIVFLLVGHVTGTLSTEKKSSSLFIDGRYMRDKFFILKREGGDINCQGCQRRFHDQCAYYRDSVSIEGIQADRSEDLRLNETSSINEPVILQYIPLFDVCGEDH